MVFWFKVRQGILADLDPEQDKLSAACISMKMKNNMYILICQPDFFMNLHQPVRVI